VTSQTVSKSNLIGFDLDTKLEIYGYLSKTQGKISIASKRGDERLGAWVS